MTKLEYAYAVSVQAVILCIAAIIAGHYSSNNICATLLGIIALSVNCGYGAGRLASIKE